MCDCLLGSYSYSNTYRRTARVRLFVRLLLLQEHLQEDYMCVTVRLLLLQEHLQEDYMCVTVC